MRVTWDGVLTFALVTCALVTTGLVVRREFFAPPTSPALAAVQKPMFIETWRSHFESGVRIGSLDDAPVQVIEFADFECPYCAVYHATLKTLRDRYPGKVALSFVHYPLPGHRFAEAAARAAECADQQGRFEAMHDQLFERQREFGLTPWRDFAASAGVTDEPAFEACVNAADAVPRIEAGKRLGRKVGIQGTPALIVNGWKLGSPPTLDELDRMVKAILSGKSPLSEA